MRLCHDKSISQRAPLRYPHPGLVVQPLPSTTFELNRFTSKSQSIANDNVDFAECIVSSTMYRSSWYAGTSHTSRQHDRSNASESLRGILGFRYNVKQGIVTSFTDFTCNYSCLRTWYIPLQTFCWHRANCYQAQCYYL